MLFCFIAFIYFTSYGNCKQTNMPKTADNYGPYNQIWDFNKPCCGPKAQNLTEFYVSPLVENGVCTGAVINVTYLEDTLIDQIKISVFKINGDEQNKQLLWNYRDSNPCQHYLFSSLIKKYLNAPYCLVKKGFYTTHVNTGEIMQTFLGTSFFYGTYLFKSLLLSKKGNVFCILSQTTFVKKT